MRRNSGVRDVLQEFVSDVLGIVAIGVVGLVVWVLCAMVLTRL